MTRWFWIISCDNTVDNPLVTDSGDLGIDPDRLWAGEKLASWNESAWLGVTTTDPESVPDDVLQNHLGLPVYSDRLRSALHQAGIAGIQFLPVRIILPAGKECLGFAIANVIELRKALDLVRSDFDVFPSDYFLPERRGNIRALRKAVLKGEALAGCDIVRLAQFRPSLYVSENFKRVFEAGNFTGYSFQEVLTVSRQSGL